MIYNIGAAATALAAYVIVALAAGWLVSTALAGASPGWPRFLAEAMVSTVLGMAVSRRLTIRLFPSVSGRVVFAAFAAVTLAAVAPGLTGHGRPASWLPILQSLLLIALAYGLFWRSREPEPDRSGSRVRFGWRGRRG